MSVVPSLQAELDEIGTLQYITDVLSDISAIKIREIRAGFERNASFYAEVAQMYHLVKVIAQGEGIKANHEDGQHEAYIALTSNRRFYGSLNLDVMNRFVEDVGGSTKGERWVVGQTGEEIYRRRKNLANCRYYSFTKDEPSKDEKRELLGELAKYEKVIVYYPKFVTVFNQEVGTMDIAQKPAAGESLAQKVEFIFEPELPAILQFFEDQVRHILFNRVMLETQLSRVAARLWSMSAAQERASEEFHKKRIELSQAVRSMKNARLLDSVGALAS